MSHADQGVNAGYYMQTAAPLSRMFTCICSNDLLNAVKFQQYGVLHRFLFSRSVPRESELIQRENIPDVMRLGNNQKQLCAPTYSFCTCKNK